MNSSIKWFEDETENGIPTCFSVVPEVYKAFLQQNNTIPSLNNVLQELDIVGFSNLEEVGRKARNIILAHKFSYTAQVAILSAYQILIDSAETDVLLVISNRTDVDTSIDFSSAEHEICLVDISGEDELLKACLDCYVAVFSDEAIVYRSKLGISYMDLSHAIIVKSSK